MELITSKRTQLVNELRMNHIPYEFGKNMNHVILDDCPKVRMAIRMIKERFGMQSIIKVS